MLAAQTDIQTGLSAVEQKVQASAVREQDASNLEASLTSDVVRKTAQWEAARQERDDSHAIWRKACVSLQDLAKDITKAKAEEDDRRETLNFFEDGFNEFVEPCASNAFSCKDLKRKESGLLRLASQLGDDAVQLRIEMKAPPSLLIILEKPPEARSAAEAGKFERLKLALTNERRRREQSFNDAVAVTVGSDDMFGLRPLELDEEAVGVALLYL